MFRKSADFQALMQIEIFKSLKQLQKLGESWRLSMKEQIAKQLLSEREEQNRHKQASTETMERKRLEESLDMIVDTDEPPGPISERTQEVPTREDLYNMCLQLQKQIKTIEDKMYALENQNATTNI